MYTKIRLTSRTQAEMARMVMRYFGADDLKPLMKDLSALLSRKHRRKVEVIYVPTPNHGPGHIRVGIVVEGELDQGVFFDKPLPAPGNDDGERLALTA